MSVLIKGMKMPTSCAMCEWSSLSKMDLGMSVYCKLSKTVGNLDIAKKQRIEECPLIEVPTPHGRLVDADWISVEKALPTETGIYVCTVEEPKGTTIVECVRYVSEEDVKCSLKSGFFPSIRYDTNEYAFWNSFQRKVIAWIDFKMPDRAYRKGNEK